MGRKEGRRRERGGREGERKGSGKGRKGEGKWKGRETTPHCFLDKSNPGYQRVSSSLE